MAFDLKEVIISLREVESKLTQNRMCTRPIFCQPSYNYACDAVSLDLCTNDMPRGLTISVFTLREKCSKPCGKTSFQTRKQGPKVHRLFLSVAWPTGVQLVFFFCSGVSRLFGAQGSPSSGSLLNL